MGAEAARLCTPGVPSRRVGTVWDIGSVSENPAPAEPTGTPARHQRSTAGLIGALLVTVLVIVAFVAFRGVFRTDVDTTPVTVDLEEAVAGARDAGLRPVHPERLPEGWKATSVEVRPTPDAVWSVGMLTTGGDYVGIRQADESASALLTEHVDEDVRERGPVEVSSPVASEWTAYDDEGGDVGYVTDLGEGTVLVYGSAPAAEVEGFLTLLQR